MGIERLGCGLAVGGVCAIRHIQGFTMSDNGVAFRVTKEFGLWLPDLPKRE